VFVGVIKFVPLPALFVWQMLGAAELPGAGTISALVAIAFVLAGVFMFGTLKTRADESERLMKLAREEAAIERDKADRLEAENARLKAQPNLTEHAHLLRKLSEAITKHEEHSETRNREMIELLRDIRSATHPSAS
jgi:uncharacterized membrane protein YfbV (UPF0208 family)